MNLSYANRIRSFLAERPQRSATVSEISAALNINDRTIRRCCEFSMPDVYIDRWIKGKNGQYHAVWTMVYVPKNCPHPRYAHRDEQPETQWVRR